MIRTYLLAQLYDITYTNGTVAANQRLPDASDKIIHAKSVSEKAVVLYPVNARWHGENSTEHRIMSALDSTIHFDNSEQVPASAGRPYCGLDSSKYMKRRPRDIKVTKDRAGVTCKRCLLKMSPPSGGKLRPQPRSTGGKVIGAGGVPLDTARTRNRERIAEVSPTPRASR